MQTVFEAAGGMDGLRRLAGAWHRRVMADDVVAHAFSHGFPTPIAAPTSNLLGEFILTIVAAPARRSFITAEC
jgi:hypothetical protein